MELSMPRAAKVEANLTGTKDCQIRTKLLAAHLDVPMYVMLETAVKLLHATYRLPEPLALSDNHDVARSRA